MLSTSISYSLYSAERLPDCPKPLTPSGSDLVLIAPPSHASECGCASTIVTSGAARSASGTTSAMKVDRSGPDFISARAASW